jgi:TonB family protein
MKTASLRALAAAAALLCSTAHAAWQDVPESVMAPYRAYLEAYEADDGEAAARLAETVYQAGRREGIEPALMAALAENRAQAYSDNGQRELARQALIDLAGLQRGTGAEPLEVSNVLRRAAQEAYLGDDIRQAYQLAERAADLAAGHPASAELFMARAIQAHAEWSRNRQRQAGLRAEEALAVLEQAGAVATNDTAMMAFMAGVGRIVVSGNDDAAFFFTISSALMQELGTDMVTLEAARAWSAYARSNLSHGRQARLLDRLSESVFAEMVSAEPERWEKEGPEIPEGSDFVDAAPIRRGPPSYPVQAAEAGANGVSVHRFTVGADGSVTNSEILFSIPHPMFGEAGDRAIRRWTYEPALLDGVPVEREGVVTSFQFTMRN